MAWTPISNTIPQYQDLNGDNYSGAVLKAYAAGTTTNINMAIDSGGITQVSTIKLDSNGYPSVSGNVVLPYLEEKYKLALYSNQTAADSNENPIWMPDNIDIAGTFGKATQLISSNTTIEAGDIYNHFEASSTMTVTLPDISGVGAAFVFTIRNAGTGNITLQAGANDSINESSDGGSIVLYPGGSALVQSGANWAANISQLNPPGSVIKVLSTTATDTSSISSTTFSDISGLSLNIQPIATSSKVLVMFSIVCSNNEATSSPAFDITRDGDSINTGDAAGSRFLASSGQVGIAIGSATSSASHQFLDSPASTSSLNYKIQAKTLNAGSAVFINRTLNDIDNSSHGRYTSTLTLMEIAG